MRDFIHTIPQPIKQFFLETCRYYHSIIVNCDVKIWTPCCSTCANILIFSRGAVAVLETTPATPPARRALQMGTDAGGKGGGARSAPIVQRKLYLPSQETQLPNNEHTAVLPQESCLKLDQNCEDRAIRH